METNLKYINQICVDLGGTGGHILNVRGENEICTLLGGTGGHSLEINALNEICTIQGVTAGHSLVLNALNAIAGVTKVTNLEAWKYIQSGSVLNQEPEYKAILDAAIAAGYTLPGSLVQIEQNKFLKALKISGAWVDADCIQFYRNDVGGGFSSLCWKNPVTGSATLVNSPSFVTNRGYLSDGISSHINTNFTPSGLANYKLNNAGIIVIPFQLIGANIAGITTTGVIRMLVQSVNYQRINAGTNTLNANFEFGSTINIKSINRSSSTNVRLYNGKVYADLTQTSVALPTEPIRLMRTSTSYSANGMSVFIAGANMSAYIDAIQDAYDVYVANTI